MVLSVSSDACFLAANLIGQRVIFSRCPFFLEVFMISFMTSCFDLLFDLLKSDNMLIVLPFCSLVVSFLFILVFRLIRGKYY